VDFIVYGDWFVGNVADIAIVVAACLMVVQSLRGIGLDGSRVAHQDRARSGDAGIDADADADVAESSAVERG
jgi:signal peptidase II